MTSTATTSTATTSPPLAVPAANLHAAPAVYAVVMPFAKPGAHPLPAEQRRPVVGRWPVT